LSVFYVIVEFDVDSITKFVKLGPHRGNLDLSALCMIFKPFPEGLNFIFVHQVQSPCWDVNVSTSLQETLAKRLNLIFLVKNAGAPFPIFFLSSNCKYQPPAIVDKHA